ncbi:hypothetical protein BGZ94_005508, partial [Podila epigama]
MREHPSLGDTAAASRKQAFNDLLSEQGFYTGLVSELHRPVAGTRSNNDRSPAYRGREAARNFERKFDREHWDAFERAKNHLEKKAPTAFLEFIARNLQSELHNNWEKFALELKKRVLVSAKVWASNGVGKTLLDSISDGGKSKKHDPKSLTWILNAVLPKDSRLALFPTHGYKDHFVDVTEAYLLAALRRDRVDDSKCLQALYKNLYPQDTLDSKRGKLFDELFYTGRGNNYNRQTTFIDTTRGPYAKMIKNVEKTRKAGAKDETKELKSSLAHELSRLNQRAAPATGFRKKYILRGSLSTDGYQVNMHVSHLGHLRRDPQQSDDTGKGAQGASVAPPALGMSVVSSSSMDDDGAPSSSTAPPPPCAPPPSATSIATSSPAYSYRKKSRISTTVDPGIRQAVSSATIDTLDPSHVRIHDISSGDLRFNERLFQSRLRKAKKEKKDSINRDMNDIEAALVSFQMDDVTARFSAGHWSDALFATNMTIIFANCAANLTAFIHSSLLNFVWLRDLYGVSKMKRWTPQRKKGARADEDKAIQSIVNTTKKPWHENHPIADKST